jgi:preprotein translocase subunit SecE
MTETTVKKENFFVKTKNNVSKFFRDIKNEIKKIVWPAPKTVFNNTGVVLVTIIIIGLFIFGLDTVLMNLLGLIMQIAK